MKGLIDKLQPVTSLRERIEEQLAAAIVTGDMEPGHVFSAPALAVQFGVSVTPVREALMNLENRGFVVTLRNKGFRITEVSDEDMQHIVNIRRMLEPPSMRALAAHYPHERADHFRALAERTISAAATGDLADYITTDTAFHVGLLECLGNTRLTAIVADLRAQTRLVGLAHLKRSSDIDASTREHHALLELLENGDGAAAESLMHRHIGHVIGQWAGLPERD